MEGIKTIYRVLDEHSLRRIAKSNIYYWIIAGFISLIFSLEMLWISTTKGDKVDVISRVIMFIFFIILLLCFIFAIIEILHVKRSDIPTHISIDCDRIVLITYNKKQKIYPFDEFTGKLQIDISFSRALPEFRYNYMAKFFDNGIDKILRVLKKKETHDRNKETFLNILINKSKKRGAWFALIISPSVIGGVERVENMLNEWKEKYENYLRKTGKYNEILEKERYTEEEDRKKAVRHLLYLIGLIAFGVISLIYLSLIPYVNTPKSSPDYDIVVTLLALDLAATLTLVLLGVMIILSLWRKHIKRGDGK